MTRSLCTPWFLLLAAAAVLPLRADPSDDGQGPEVLTAAGASRFKVATNPWLGFNKDRAMYGQVEKFIAVDDVGTLNPVPFPPAIDAADFLKKGMPDILMIDGDGYVRYFPNSGTKEAPKFAEGIVLPVLLPRSPLQFQVVDYDGDGRPDLVIGDDVGNLYMLHNQGGTDVPRFDSPRKLERVRVDIAAGGNPWCNFVSPAYAQWRPGGTVMDLIMGDGTYASDNIYFLHNSGSTERPKFDPKVLLITGDGRQHLTARACYWTSKDKPDLLVGERNGPVSLYVNDMGENDIVPKFKPAMPLAAGGNASFAPLGRLAAADLNGDGKPDLLWTDAQGVVWYSLNTGTAQAPVFAAGTPLKRADAPKPYAVPTGWTFRGVLWGGNSYPQAGGFFYFLHTVGIDSQNPATFEPGLTMPDGSPSKQAIKFEFMDPPSQVTSLYPPYLDDKDQEGGFSVFYTDNGYAASNFGLKEKTPYKFSCQVKGDGFNDLQVTFVSAERLTDKSGNRQEYRYKSIGFQQDVSLSSSWHKFEYVHSFQFDKDADDYGKNAWATGFLYFHFSGKGTLYLTDVSIKPMAK